MSDLDLDLVWWDFGDALCDETFQRISPPRVPQWPEVYEQVLAERPDWVEGWNLGRGSMNDLIEPLAQRLAMTPGQVSRHLRAVWHQIVWFDEAMEWLRLLESRVAQAIVTVNPWEFSGTAAATGLEQMVDVVVPAPSWPPTASRPWPSERGSS
ncbi:MAG: hypothetical protein GY698_00565 [Actinomycetia bacterium]|nr:hypothetical protein [Actinomycetes bacterium]